jgi:toxin-antitoxin system PIN domain toxin
VFVVDTNILIYAASRQFPEHGRARALVERWRRGATPWFSTWPILYEFLRVTTHRAVLERPLKIAQAWAFLEVLFDAPGFGLLVETERHAGVLAAIQAEYPSVAGSLVHDFHTAVLMSEHGLKEIRTADSDFHQFKFLRVVNPVAG